MAHVTVGSARIDEHGQAHGGKAGDQTGGEVSTQRWYLHKQGKWIVLRPKRAYDAQQIAKCMRAACDNPHIGYDQYERDSLYKIAQAVDFDCARVTQDCETDCSALVRVCLAYAGIYLESFRTWNEAQHLLASGKFVEMTGDAYQLREDYLRAGDVLVTPNAGHTVVVLTNGDRAYETPEEITEREMDEMDMIKSGSRGAQVRTLQRLLNAILKAGLDVDGDFGPATKTALVAYQSARGLEVDGICGPASWKRLLKGE